MIDFPIVDSHLHVWDPAILDYPWLPGIPFLNRPFLPKDYEEAKGIIYEAMRAGRLFVAHDNLSDARGFRFEYVAEDGSNLLMGEEGDSYPGELFIELPQSGEIRLLRNGELVRSWRGREAAYRVDAKGVYRVEIYKHVFLFGWRPWIYSNPIYLR